MLILPGNPLYLPTLATPPPIKGQAGYGYVCRVGSDVLELADERDLDEYLEGGEYETRLLELDEGEADIDELTSDILYLPDSIQFTRT
jgi:hypothetical protein